MPRTIRKRQLRNKKSRKQRGGVNKEQIAQIKEIKKKIDDSIKELLSVLGEPETPKNYNIQSKGEYESDKEYTTQEYNPMVIGNEGVNMDMPTGAPPPIPDTTTNKTN